MATKIDHLLRIIILAGALSLLYIGICGVATIIISAYVTGGYPIDWMPNFTQFIIKDVLLYLFNNLRAHIAFIIPFVWLANFYAIIVGVSIIWNIVKEARKYG